MQKKFKKLYVVFNLSHYCLLRDRAFSDTASSLTSACRALARTPEPEVKGRRKGHKTLICEGCYY